MKDPFQHVRRHYDAIADYGPYATLAPHNRGGRKSRYVAAVFDAALLPRLACHCDLEHEPRVLDFGCGSGILTVQIAAMGMRVVGIDLSPAIIRFAQNWGQHLSHLCSFAMTDGWRMPFRNASFDIVVARESLCYVPDGQLHLVMAEFQRVMKDGGMIYILDQVSENPAWQNHPGAPYLKKRSVDDLIKAMHEAGFQVRETIAIRQPRFFWIYPVWAGLFPERLIPILAKLEVAWNKHFCAIRTHRWQDVLFVANKP
jgi:SAM-dependent methyltransferase